MRVFFFAGPVCTRSYAHMVCRTWAEAHVRACTDGHTHTPTHTPGAFNNRVLPAFHSAIKLWPWQLTFFEPDKPGPLIYIPGIEGVSIYHLYGSSRRWVQWFVKAALSTELTDKVVRTETECDMFQIKSPAHLTIVTGPSVTMTLSVPCAPATLAAAHFSVKLCKLDMQHASANGDGTFNWTGGPGDPHLNCQVFFVILVIMPY